MYLSDIEIIGFKSFAQRTKLKFASGLSAVVGPNGCGKTNIVDALRWVLGEKKASTLRSDIMENVIFNGTKDRKPLSMAEVTLTIENTKNILPIEYTDISISRRLFRNGESQYLLNKTPVRLKDITDLFMDTGIGPDSYSVIELKMVEDILSGKVEDRRAMFEEAAGIKKYKQRRKESMRKLDQVLQDMNRLEDILQEVRKNVNALSRQAAKTKRYNQLHSQLKDTEIEAMKHEFHHFSKDKLKYEAELIELNKEKIKLEFTIQENEKKINNLKVNLTAIESKHETLIEQEINLNKSIANKNQLIAVSNEKLSSLVINKDRLILEIADAENQIKSLQKELEELTSYSNEILSERTKLVNAINELKIQRDNEANKVNSQRQINSKAYETILNLDNKISSIHNLRKRSTERKKYLEQKLQQSAEEIYKFKQQLDAIEVDIKQSEDYKIELNDILHDTENEIKKANELRITLQTEIDKLRQNINDKKNNLGSKKASLDFLNSLVDTSESSKFLSNSKNWETKSEKNLLGELVGTDEEHRIAISAALGSFAHYFVVETKEEAHQGIELLKTNKKGKTGFISLENSPNINDKLSDIKDNGVIGWVSEIVRVDDNVRNVLRLLLGNMLLVENGETAEKVIRTKGVDSAVTLDGMLYHSAGSVHGGSISSNEGMWVGKKERIQKLNKEINSIQKDIEEKISNLNDIQNQFNEIDLNALNQQLRKATSDINQNNQKISQLIVKKDSIDRNLNLIDENDERFRNEIADIETDEQNTQNEIDELTIQLNKEKENHQDLVKLLTSSEEAWRVAENNLKTAEITLVNLNNDIKQTENDINYSKSQISTLTNKKKQKQDELDNFDLNKDSLEENIEKNIAELNKESEEISKVKIDKEISEDSIKSLKANIEQFENEASFERKEYDKIKENTHQLDLKTGEINVHINSIIEKAFEQYELEIQNLEFIENPEFSLQTSKAEINDIKNKLIQLGNVNFMALEEFETQSERLDFYEKQMNDLRESEKILRDTILEINTTAEKAFQETFDKIRTNFHHLFKTLFGPDGEADIMLKDTNLLESDIAITAKPPNKRPHSIEMLSGGEKTLTAIALLFGIYLVKPSPFCILDEVDAPLDDANIDKYINLIREFSKETQFLIVTHNKKTMEAAETLYGVTMQEDGVSKVVTVRLDSVEAQ